jgi:hypothetical protein
MRELGHRDTLIQPNAFLIQKKLREMEQRQQRNEEMLSAIFLAVEEIREAVAMGAVQPQGAGFRLPNARSQLPSRSLPWWKRAWYAFFTPVRLRRPDVDHW